MCNVQFLIILIVDNYIDVANKIINEIFDNFSPHVAPNSAENIVFI